MAEFTGERVIPGQVDPDLFNEHFARYAFASRLARNRRVLDVACGTGYGVAELASVAASVTGIDVSPDAIAYARDNFTKTNVMFQVAAAEQTQLEPASFDLITAFEMIEHLTDARAFLAEAKRLLTPTGQLVVSTPNRLYYEETRRVAGPNPFHTHEFDFAEFQSLLAEFFPSVLFFVQNHAASIAFQPLTEATATQVRREAKGATPEESHFFLAVAATAPQTGSPTFVYIPATTNVLGEREHHISKLEAERAQKDRWLENALREHEELLTQHRGLKGELEQRNEWAKKLDVELLASQQRVVQLQDELASEQQSARENARVYDAKIAELEKDVEARTVWAVETEKRLTSELQAKCEELAEAVKLLNTAEATVDERTKWAQNLQSEIELLQGQLSAVNASRWFRVGRTMGLGPKLLPK
ncbi:MAG: methyltransferase domain-containing protein [Candidatus Solibacter usitatus]|nr:methyltransferase domain-containing protein [Candidatus Solibacter usitatus]